MEATNSKKEQYRPPEIKELGLAVNVTQGCGFQSRDSISGQRYGGCPTVRD